MIKIIIWGAGGKMGQVLTRMILNDEETELVAGIDKFASPEDFNFTLLNSPEDCVSDADAVIDFSRPEALCEIAPFCKKRKIPVVLASTGYDDAQLKEIAALSRTVAVFSSYNMSLGINLLSALAQKAAKVLKGFDIEIIEKHHNQKADAPSGTAIMLAGAIDQAREHEMKCVYGRQGKNCKRKENEIGLHAVRGGTIVGEHDIIFAGHNEVVTLSHSAESKEIFAAGAIAAAKFIKDKPAGRYDMNDVLQ